MVCVIAATLLAQGGICSCLSGKDPPAEVLYVHPRVCMVCFWPDRRLDLSLRAARIHPPDHARVLCEYLALLPVLRRTTAAAE